MNTKNKKVTTRDGFGDALVEAGLQNEKIVVLSADLAESTRAHHFAKKFPNRFFEMGVAEENMVGTAAGFALGGKVPVTCSYAVFSPQNTMGPIRASICYSKLNVKIIGGHAGISTGPDGATHQALEDISLMRTLPNMVVLVPADYAEAKKATFAMLKHHGPCYLRIGKHADSPVTTSNTPFEIGRAVTLKEGKTVSIFSCGTMVAEALRAAEALDDHNISTKVINMHTIKPFDRFAVLDAVSHSQLIITMEEHQISGGLGSAVAEVLAELPTHPPLYRVGMHDTFGESGEGKELLQKYGLNAQAVVTFVLGEL